LFLPIKSLLDVVVTVDGVKGRGLVDPGAAVSCMSPKFVQRLKSEGKGKIQLLEGPERSLRGFFGGAMSVSRYARVEMCVGELEYVQALVVVDVPAEFDVVIGMDAFVAFSMVMRGATGEITSLGRVVRAASMEGEVPADIVPTMVPETPVVGREKAPVRGELSHADCGVHRDGPANGKGRQCDPTECRGRRQRRQPTWRSRGGGRLGR